MHDMFTVWLPTERDNGIFTSAVVIELRFVALNDTLNDVFRLNVLNVQSTSDISVMLKFKYAVLFWSCKDEFPIIMTGGVESMSTFLEVVMFLLVKISVILSIVSFNVVLLSFNNVKSPSISERTSVVLI